MLVNPEALFDTFHALKAVKKGDDTVIVPVNTQDKLDEIKLTLLDPKTGEIGINHPYGISVAITAKKAMATLVGEPEEENNNTKEEK